MPVEVFTEPRVASFEAPCLFEDGMTVQSCTKRVDAVNAGPFDLRKEQLMPESRTFGELQGASVSWRHQSLRHLQVRLARRLQSIPQRHALRVSPRFLNESRSPPVYHPPEDRTVCLAMPTRSREPYERWVKREIGQVDQFQRMK